MEDRIIVLCLKIIISLQCKANEMGMEIRIVHKYVHVLRIMLICMDDAITIYYMVI